MEENRAWIEQTFKKVDKKLSKVTVRSRDKLVDERKAGMHIPIIYVEYYFVEALLKLLGADFLAW